MLHWPLYLLMGDGRVPLDRTALALTEIAAAVVVGGVFHVLVERPLLPKPSSAAASPEAGSDVIGPRWRGDRAFLPAMGGIAIALVLVAVLVPVPAPLYDFAGAQARIEQRSNPASDGSDVVQPAVETDGGELRPVNIGVFGGSTGVLLGAAMFDFADQTSGLRAVPAWSHYGCGFLTAGQRLVRAPDGTSSKNRPDPECDGWEQSWVDATREHSVQVALVVTGVWETTDWDLDGNEGSSTIWDLEFDEVLRAQITHAFDDLVSLGTHIVVTTAPNIGPGSSGHARADRGLSDDHPQRIEIYNQLLRDVAASRDEVTVVEYGAYLDSFSPDQSAAWLPDGIHPTDPAARQIWLDYLGPSLLDTIAGAWPDLAPGSVGLATTDGPIPVPSPN